MGKMYPGENVSWIVLNDETAYIMLLLQGLMAITTGLRNPIVHDTDCFGCSSCQSHDELMDLQFLGKHGTNSS